MFAKITFLSFIVAIVVANDGWMEGEKVGTYIGEIKNCSKSDSDNQLCYISVWFNIGRGVVTGGYGGSYIINTYSAPRFIRESSHLVKLPTIETTSNIKFVPWMNCGLSTIDISLNTPDEAMIPFRDIANNLKCDEFDTDNDVNASNQIKWCNLLGLLSFMMIKLF